MWLSELGFKIEPQIWVLRVENYIHIFKDAFLGRLLFAVVAIASQGMFPSSSLYLVNDAYCGTSVMLSFYYIMCFLLIIVLHRFWECKLLNVKPF